MTNQEYQATNGGWGPIWDNENSKVTRLGDAAILLNRAIAQTNQDQRETTFCLWAASTDMDAYFASRS